MTVATPELLLAEVEELLRTMPARADMSGTNPDVLAWLGKGASVIDQWKIARRVLWESHVASLGQLNMGDASSGYGGLVTLLYEAQYSLRMATTGPLTVAIGARKPHQYFDAVRKYVEGARIEVFFVDPYLDGEFVSRYLPCVPHGVAVRLLVARKSLPKLLAAVGVYRQETALSVEVRSYEQFHDRYLFVDRAVCYQSGASFKDGAKNDPTTLIQVSDAFASVAKTYEAMWAVAIVHP